MTTAVQVEAPSAWERRVVGGFVKTVFLWGRRRPLPPPPAELRPREVVFEGNTGATVHGRWFAAERPRGTVVLAHPDKRLAQHWFVHEGWVAFLHRHGYDVLTFDFPGYGASHGPATYYHEDVVAAARLGHEWSGMLPVHVMGVSLGAFAVANAAPRMPWVKSIVLESPYPSFNAWYGGGPGYYAMRTFDLAFRRTSAAIQADRNIPHAPQERILIGIATDDEITRTDLSEILVRNAPPDRTRVLRVPGKHFAPTRSDAYRKAVLETFG